MNNEKLVNVKNIFEGISEKMLIDFDQIQSQINHSGERGEQRELALAKFLKKYLPQKYAIGSGQIIDSKGGISKQCDIVLFDAFNCPLLMVDEGYQLFPVEAVIGVIEVKSILNSKTLTESVHNMQSVMRLKRDEPIAGFIFGYRSSYEKEPRIEGVANALRRIYQNIPSHEHADIICVLSDGLIREYKTEPDWGRNNKSLDMCLEAAPSVLLLFLFWLIEILGERHSSIPSLVRYASHGEIGLFKRADYTDIE